MKVMLLLSFSLTHKVFFLPGGGERGGRKAGTDRGRRGEHWRRPVWSHSPVLRDGHCVHFGFWWDPGCSCVSQHWSCTTLNIASAGPVCLFHLWISSHTQTYTENNTHSGSLDTPELIPEKYSHKVGHFPSCFPSLLYVHLLISALAACGSSGIFTSWHPNRMAAVGHLHAAIKVLPFCSCVVTGRKTFISFWSWLVVTWVWAKLTLKRYQLRLTIWKGSFMAFTPNVIDVSWADRLYIHNQSIEMAQTTRDLMSSAAIGTSERASDTTRMKRTMSDATQINLEKIELFRRHRPEVKQRRLRKNGHQCHCFILMRPELKRRGMCQSQPAGGTLGKL